ncbi:MAG: GNAT family N-acetyltransferase [Microthrixaceae bacterium]
MSGEPSDLRAVDATGDDLAEIAALHIEAFPESVLGRLGLEAVRRNYVWQFEGPHDVTALVVHADDSVAGYLFGGVFRGSTIGFVKSQKWFLAGQVMRRPRVVLGELGRDRLGLALRLLVRRRPPVPTAERPEAVPRRSFGVLAIAVDPRMQGHGVGRTLMAAAEQRARRQGFEAMHLSVHPGNERAVRFYESLGFARAVDADGAWEGQMRRDLPPVDASAE